jgi:hypothetical protein
MQAYRGVDDLHTEEEDICIPRSSGSQWLLSAASGDPKREAPSAKPQREVPRRV